VPDIGLGELAVLFLVAILVIGPERLPKFAAEAGRVVRQLREMGRNARAQLREEMGPEFADVRLRDLHPRELVRQHLLTDDEAPRAPAVPRLPDGERPPYDADAT
jgi:sec-independent protein translocase protein TatB